MTIKAVQHVANLPSNDGVYDFVDHHYIPLPTVCGMTMFVKVREGSFFGGEYPPF